MNVNNFWKHPMVNHILLQIIFWSIINTLLSVYIFLFLDSMEFALGVSFHISFPPLIICSLCLAVFHGVVLGSADFVINQRFFVVKSVGRLVVFQIMLSLIVFIATFYGLRYFLTETSLSRVAGDTHITKETWSRTFYILFFQYSVGSLIVTFSIHIVKKYGKDVFLPLLLGAYRRPREEQRIFMFLDLKSSTALAEHLGHIKYSEMVQDFILDVNRCLAACDANIYQYAGDEVVLTWKTSAQNTALCLKFFFSCERLLQKRSSFYMDRYGVVPTFKAGADCGTVTAVEIGDIKRDIAYHGDTLNTASRIQNLCNTVGRKLLISETLLNTLKNNNDFAVEPLGNYVLKGKEKLVSVISVAEHDVRT